MTELQYRRWQEFSLAMARAGWEKMTEARREKLAKEVERYFLTLECGESWRDIKSWDEPEEGCWHHACDDVSETFDKYLHEKPFARGHIDVYGRFFDQIACCIRAGLDIASAPSAGVLGFTIGDLRRMFPDWDTRLGGRMVPERSEGRAGRHGGMVMNEKRIIFTFGYSGNPNALDDLRRLVEEGATIVDIRFLPWSWKRGFIRSELEREFGAKYLWCKNLGNRNYKGGEIALSDERNGMEWLEIIAPNVPNLILLCGCEDFAHCHRAFVWFSREFRDIFDRND